MKRKILFIVLTCLTFANVKGQSNYNYVKTVTPTTATNNTSGFTVDNSITTYQYLDGLGRKQQTVQVGASAGKTDLVAYQEYDIYGRESKAWLPVAATGSNGQPLTLTTVQSLSSSLYADSKAYSLPVYEASPLNRVLEQYGPGADWYTQGRKVKTEYLVNNTSYPCRWYRTTDSRSDAPQVSIASGNLNYTAGQLFVTRITDEDNNVSYEFKDKQGKLLLTRQMAGTVSYDTYYVYDSYGNLRVVLPPLAADALTAAGTWKESADATDILSRYAYLYKYDSRNRMIAKKLPGDKVEWTYYVYDDADRLIFTQDGENRTNSKWLFCIPDELGRTVLTGTCTNSMTYTANPLAGKVAKATRNNTTNAYKGYTLTGVSLSSAEILSVNYYDDYNFMGKNGIKASTDANFKYETVSGYGTQYITSSKGLLTGTMSAQINQSTVSTSFLYSVMYYDNRGRMIQMKSNNQLGGVDKEYIGYNFSGQPIKRKLVHSATGKTAQTQLYEYNYDHAGRLLNTKHGLNTSTAGTVIALNTYDNLGRLKTQKKGSLPATTYGYNVRSWMKSITNSTLFSQTLYYNDAYASNTKCYSGNVSAMSWKVGSETLRGYRFGYDALSRITKAEYLLNGAVNNNYKVPSVIYDKHGNITDLERWGKTASGYGVVDKLKLTYTGNQLTKVVDSAVKTPAVTSGLNDFYDKDNATDYTYNKNGALAKDLNKGISNITYNCLNLPSQLTVNGVSNKYTYAADGRKLKLHYGTGNDSINYARGIIYEKGSLKHILIDGGYIEGTTYNYYLNDHLGNNRVVATGTGTIVQKNHFYPFGMTFGETPNAEQDKQRFKYNGKELDRKNGLNWLDYSARQMEPGIGRFTMMDPHAEKYYSWSPYHYAGNNPMRITDPTGMDWYVNSSGDYRWQEGSEEIEGYTNIGANYTVQTGKNSYLAYYQNAAIQTNREVKAFDLISQHAVLQNKFLGKNSYLSEDSKSQLFNALVSNRIDALARPIGIAATTQLAGGLLGKGIAWGIGKVFGHVMKGYGRVFWSGEGGLEAAMNYAQSVGGTTLEMTRAAQNLEKLIALKNIPWSEARLMWARLSAVYAKGAKGTVHFFSGKTVNPGSIWNTVEKPILIEKNIKIITH
ncbi:DUF6443 domain-containing protein [Bacteroides sp. 519]|uniref:DUF6443 domain-containing protein n=1 Tax=Bacteroides sp. 519 TaxID=2302937 RepID=UPI0013CFC60F|nr:DUF6443 domain-containing protein [Bacteroides sp. 519]NDV60152.1 RHS repeat-associated core domain-containing protein [Bacteroides sp. 519]